VMPHVIRRIRLFGLRVASLNTAPGDRYFTPRTFFSLVSGKSHLSQTMSFEEKDKDVESARPAVSVLPVRNQPNRDHGTRIIDRDDEALAALGHKAQLERRFSFVSLCGAAFAGGIPSWASVIGSLILVVDSAGMCVLLVAKTCPLTEAVACCVWFY
jgi:hypothetical protein